MSNKKTDSYFKKRNSQDSVSFPNLETSINLDNVASKYQDSFPESSPTKVQKIDQSSNCPHIERDPGLHKSIWDYPVDKKDEIRRAYLIIGPYQGIPEKSPQYSSTYYEANAFTIDGFQTWKKVNDGKNYSFMIHEGNSLNSSHKIAIKHCHDLMNLLQHIEKFQLMLQDYVDFEGIAFRTHNECLDSHNRGNFLEIMKHTASYNDKVRSIVLENAPQNASYISPQIQKEILSLYASRIQRFIREEIGDVKYCLIVDESRDESKREQMVIVLRFVDKKCFIRVRFFEYDGASTMRGEWNGLQTLFLNECPYAYYVHCFAHRLQLTLVSIVQSVIPIEHFFSYLAVIVNLVDSSSKRHDQVYIANVIRILELTSTNELEIGKSLLSLLDMFDPILLVLSEIINYKSSLSTKASINGAYVIITSFEFVFILHFIDNLNAMDTVVNTKELVQKFRENGWDQLFDKVKSFCDKHKIDVPNMNMSYRFDENAVELFKLSSTLDPRDRYKSFNINDICKLVEKFYPSDFTNIRRNIHFQNVSTLSELYQLLSKTGKTMNYYLVDRLIKLILTLSIFIAITERAFSCMKFVKTRLRNKMEDDFLASSLLIYIEKEIAQNFSIDSIIDEFDVIKKRQEQFRMPRLNK
ncbi:hypothetical protein Pfo_001816 [Paulownia fortunei]|nr:hypothetical protein Pfo_001816 [Paulownia fortunei]